MIFQWYFKTKFPNFHDNSECHKTEKHRITSFAWPPYTSYVNFWLLLRKSVKVFLLDLKNSISVNNLYNKIHLFTQVVSQTYVYFRIQWFFHEWLSQNSMIFPWFFHFYKFQELFMKFSDFSMILKQIWISMIFQELWEPCLWNKLQWNLNQNSFIFILEIAFQSVVCEMVSILSRPQSSNIKIHNFQNVTRGLFH